MYESKKNYWLLISTCLLWVNASPCHPGTVVVGTWGHCIKYDCFYSRTNDRERLLKSPSCWKLILTHLIRWSHWGLRACHAWRSHRRPWWRRRWPWRPKRLGFKLKFRHTYLASWEVVDNWQRTPTMPGQGATATLGTLHQRCAAHPPAPGQQSFIYNNDCYKIVLYGMPWRRYVF